MSSPIRFDNQVVLITGAGRGLGTAYAHLFAERGATVIVHDAGVECDGSGGDPKPAHSVAESITAKGGLALVETQNLWDRAACRELIGNVVERCGRLDALVHSAGLVVYKGVKGTSPRDWETMQRVNIDAPFWLCQAAWPIMEQQGYGRIVLTVSGYGLFTFEGSGVTAYSMGKAAQYGLMNGLAGEGKQRGIKVNAISPVAATRMFRRDAAPEELRPESVAPGVVLLGSRECPWSGKVLRAAGGTFSVGEFHTTRNHELGNQATPEKVLEVVRES